MSIKIMVKVWEKELDDKEQSIMLALADHANEAGCNVRPSIALISWKTGKSIRTVQRIVKRLRAKKYIREVRSAGRYRPAEYKICINDIPNKKPFSEWKKEVMGDKLTLDYHESWVTNQADMGDKSDFMGDKKSVMGDTAMSPEPSYEPSLNNNRHKKEPKDNAARDCDLSKQEKLTFGEFVKLSDVEHRKLIEKFEKEYGEQYGKGIGEKFVEKCIEKLDNYIGGLVGKKKSTYMKKDHSRCILGWVSETIEDKMEKQAGYKHGYRGQSSVNSLNSKGRIQQNLDAIDEGLRIAHEMERSNA